MAAARLEGIPVPRKRRTTVRVEGVRCAPDLVERFDVSMRPVGDCYDNAVCEAFHSTLKRELVHPRPWPTRAELKTAVFEYIEGFYNTTRRHSTIGHLSPAQYEEGRLPVDITSRLSTPAVELHNAWVVHVTLTVAPDNTSRRCTVEDTRSNI